MRLTVLGCSGSMPGPAGPASSYLVEADGARLLLDLGNGALGPLIDTIGVDGVTRLDGILLSHLHPDHFIDMCGLYVLLKYGPIQPARRIPVWGPAGTAARLAAAYGLPTEPGMSAEFDVTTYPTEGFTVGPFAVRAAQVSHPIEAFAFRVEHGGRTIAYSGDTGPSKDLVDLAVGADLFLCEAGFVDDDPNNPSALHLSAAQAGEHAQAADVAKLLVTHVPPWGNVDAAVAAASETFYGQVEAATVGKSWKA